METILSNVEHPTFETVWAALQENAASLKKMEEERKQEAEEYRKRQEEYRKRQEEYRKRQEEYRKRQEERDRRWEERSARLDEKLGKLGNRIGDIVECMVTPNLCEKFFNLGLDYLKITRNTIFTEDKKYLFEVDLLLENGDKAMLIEVKTTPNINNVHEHMERMGKMRAYADQRGDKRVFLGGIAGAVMEDAVKKYALEQGFFVLEPSGDIYEVIPRPAARVNGNDRVLRAWRYFLRYEVPHAGENSLGKGVHKWTQRTDNDKVDVFKKDSLAGKRCYKNL